MDLEAFKDLEYLREFRRTLEKDLNVSPPFIDISFKHMLNFLRRLFHFRS